MLRHFECEFFTGLKFKIVRAIGVWGTHFLMGSKLNLMPNEQT